MQRELARDLSIFASSAEVTGVERCLSSLQILACFGEIGTRRLAGETLLRRRHRLTRIAHLLHGGTGACDEQHQHRECGSETQAVKPSVLRSPLGHQRPDSCKIGETDAISARR